MAGTIESTTGPEAICVQCFARFPVSRDDARWIEEDGARVLCPDCYHEATGIDHFTEEDDRSWELTQDLTALPY